jgi:hypothetical protein
MECATHFKAWYSGGIQFWPFSIDAAEVTDEEIKMAVAVPIDHADLGAHAGFVVLGRWGVIIVTRPGSGLDERDTFGELRLCPTAQVAIQNHAAIAQPTIKSSKPSPSQSAAIGRESP